MGMAKHILIVLARSEFGMSRDAVARFCFKKGRQSIWVKIRYDWHDASTY